jgi:hypothetical protein
MANDPNTIQYVIQEDGFWYIASKEKNPYVPELTVSAKGVANGLSTEYNDGYDFGPDSYDPNSTASIPYTQTSGIQEAWNYALSFGSIVQEVHLLSGVFMISAPIIVKYINEPSYFNSDNEAAISAPSIVGVSNPNGMYNYSPLGTVIQCSDSFPSGEYAIAYIVPDTAFVSGATNPQFIGARLQRFTLDCNNLGAGICLFQLGNSRIEDIAIRDPTTPSPSLTKGISSTQQSIQTGAFVQYLTSNSGEYSIFSHIQIRGTAYEDGFVLYNIAGPSKFDTLWCSHGAQRYGFNVACSSQYPTYLVNPESDPIGGWTGSVPNTGDPQSAGYLFTLAGGKIIIENNQTFLGAPAGMPYIYVNGTYDITLIGGTFYATNNTSAGPYVIESPSSYRLMAINSSFSYNSLYNGAIDITGFATYASSVFLSLIDCYFNDNNSGTQTYKPVSITYPSSFPYPLHLSSFVDNQGRYLGGMSPTLSANPPSSATAYQNTNPYDIRIYLPAYATTSGTAGTVAYGEDASSTVTEMTAKFINGATSSTAVDIIELFVPAGHYYEFTASGVTFGTAVVKAV